MCYGGYRQRSKTLGHGVRPCIEAGYCTASPQLQKHVMSPHVFPGSVWLWQGLQVLSAGEKRLMHWKYLNSLLIVSFMGYIPKAREMPFYHCISPVAKRFASFSHFPLSLWLRDHSFIFHYTNLAVMTPPLIFLAQSTYRV